MKIGHLLSIFILSAIHLNVLATTHPTYALKIKCLDEETKTSVDLTSLLIFGARLAKGCTSGHGISGMGMLSTASIIAVAAMFTGGAIVALIV